MNGSRTEYGLYITKEHKSDRLSTQVVFYIYHNLHHCNTRTLPAKVYLQITYFTLLKYFHQIANAHTIKGLKILNMFPI